ncbi:MAG: hypothetical protein AAF152_21685 [Cyanobacteria bacterium P01_A01_bin.114]
MNSTQAFPFWLSYRDAEFETKPLGFEAIEDTDTLSEYDGLGCPLCGAGVYRIYQGVKYVSCDRHYLKQRLTPILTTVGD